MMMLEERMVHLAQNWRMLNGHIHLVVLLHIQPRQDTNFSFNKQTTGVIETKVALVPLSITIYFSRLFIFYEVLMVWYLFVVYLAMTSVTHTITSDAMMIKEQ